MLSLTTRAAFRLDLVGRERAAGHALHAAAPPLPARMAALLTRKESFHAAAKACRVQLFAPVPVGIYDGDLEICVGDLG